MGEGYVRVAKSGQSLSRRLRERIFAARRIKCIGAEFAMVTWLCVSVTLASGGLSAIAELLVLRVVL